MLRALPGTGQVPGSQSCTCVISAQRVLLTIRFAADLKVSLHRDLSSPAPVPPINCTSEHLAATWSDWRETLSVLPTLADRKKAYLTLKALQQAQTPEMQEVCSREPSAAVPEPCTQIPVGGRPWQPTDAP